MKKIITTVLLAVFGLALSGCGESSSSNPPPTPTTSFAPETIKSGERFAVKLKTETTLTFTILEFSSNFSSTQTNALYHSTGTYIARSAIGATTDTAPADSTASHIFEGNQVTNGTYTYKRDANNKNSGTFELTDNIADADSSTTVTPGFLHTQLTLVFTSSETGTHLGYRVSTTNATFASATFTTRDSNRNTFSVSPQLCEVGREFVVFGYASGGSPGDNSTTKSCVFVNTNNDTNTSTFELGVSMINPGRPFIKLTTHLAGEAFVIGDGTSVTTTAGFGAVLSENPARVGTATVTAIPR